MSPNIFDRAQGCLVGLAIGDALGATVEFLNPTQIKKQFGKHRELSGEGWLRLQPGEVTDDTQLARLFGESLLQCGGWNPEHFAKQLIVWLEGSPRDVGAADREGIERMSAGLDPLQCGLSGELGSGNGSTVRGIPAAIRFFSDWNLLREVCFSQSQMTHNTLEAQWSSFLICAVAASLLQGNDFEDARQTILEWQEEIPEVLARAIRDPIDLEQPSSYVGDTLNPVFYDLLHRQGFEETLVAAVNRGGDADTTGALVGALAGARYGLAAIPERWTEAIQFGDEMKKLGDALLGAAGGEP